jgi:hypothetical protein
MAFMPLLASTNNFFRIGNYAEAVLWILVATAFGVCALRGGRARGRCAFAGVVFLLFGLSDVVEVQTGAWWRPWWLFTWKALCVLSMLWLLWDYLRRRRQHMWR